MRIGIVNDLKLACEALRRVITGSTNHQVAWTAYDGAEAAEMARRDRPDLILMDLIMPRVDGAEASRRIMAGPETRCAIVVVTSSVTGNISKVYEAMGYGALDAVDTPVLGAGGKLEGAQALIQKINTIEKLLSRAPLPRPAAPPPPKTEAEPILRPIVGPKPSSSTILTLGNKPPSGKPQSSAAIPTSREPIGPPLVVIGVSTGGPKVVAQILSDLPRNLPACIVVVQHVDSAFAPGLATWLGQQSRLPVSLAIHGQEPVPGQVFLAQTGDHLVMTPARRLGYSVEPRDQCFRPSVDVFFHSVVRYWPQPGIAVLLTGMGRDGAEGMKALKKCGWHTIAQDQASCTVYGMPKAAAEIGAALQILPPQDIAQSILSRFLKRPTT